MVIGEQSGGSSVASPAADGGDVEQLAGAIAAVVSGARANPWLYLAAGLGMLAVRHGPDLLARLKGKRR